MPSLNQTLEVKKKKHRELEQKIKQEIKNKQMNELYNLACKTGISNLELCSLHGAFLEIANGAKNQENIQRWKEAGEKQKPDNLKPLIIKFPTSLPQDIKSSLKQLNFKWNSFRGEYYGSGDIHILKLLLKNVDHEVVQI